MQRDHEPNLVYRARRPDNEGNGAYSLSFKRKEPFLRDTLFDSAVQGVWEDNEQSQPRKAHPNHVDSGPSS